jgi:hypothetical protein
VPSKRPPRRALALIFNCNLNIHLGLRTSSQLSLDTAERQFLNSPYRETPKNVLKKSPQKHLGLVGSSKVNQIYVEVRQQKFEGPLQKPVGYPGLSDDTIDMALPAGGIEVPCRASSRGPHVYLTMPSVAAGKRWLPTSSPLWA